MLGHKTRRAPSPQKAEFLFHRTETEAKYAARKDAHGRRDRDAFDGEERRPLVLPIETRARKRRVRQPGDRNVVEDIVAREALRLSVKDACDELIAPCVVIKEISR